MPTDVQGRPEIALVAMYSRLADDLRVLLAAARGGAGSAFVAAQLTELEVALRRLGERTASWASDAASDAYRASGGAAQATIPRGLIVVPGFTGVDERAVGALATRMSASMADYRDALGRGLVLGDPKIGAEAVQAVLAGRSDLVSFQADTPRVRVGDRLWAPDAYASTIARTGIADTRREAFWQRYTQNGVDVVRVVANGSDHVVCQRWEGKRVSLTGTTPDLPALDEAYADGLFHPNCRHRYVVDTAWELPTTEEQDVVRAAAAEIDARPEILGSRRPTESRRPAEARATGR